MVIFFVFASDSLSYQDNQIVSVSNLVWSSDGSELAYLSDGPDGFSLSIVDFETLERIEISLE